MAAKIKKERDFILRGKGVAKSRPQCGFAVMAREFAKSAPCLILMPGEERGYEELAAEQTTAL